MHTGDGNVALVVLGHAKRLAAGFEHANDGVALGADGKFRTDRLFPLVEEFFDEVCADDCEAVGRLGFLPGEIPSALNGVTADIEVVFFDAQHLNVGVGPLRASGQRRLGGAEDGVGDGQFFGGLLRESLRLFVGNGLADSHPSTAVHAGLGFLRKVNTSVPREENCSTTLASNEEVAVVMLIKAMMPSPMMPMVRPVRSRFPRIERTAIWAISISSSRFMYCKSTAYLCAPLKTHTMTFDLDMIRAHYERIPGRIEAARSATGKALTLAEKILYSHLWEGDASGAYQRGADYVDFAPDRVAMQDATAQMALLQFMQAGKKAAAVPSTVHCDHLIQAKVQADSDLQEAINKNNEVYNFLESVSNKYGIGFWKPGAGIIHQVVLENYAFPGGMMIGTDSHTVNAGGLGMVAVGVGGADAVDVMAGMPWERNSPEAHRHQADRSFVRLGLCERRDLEGGRCVDR